MKKSKPLLAAPALAYVLFTLTSSWSAAAIPAGGSLPTPGLGVGSGPTSAFAPGTAAASSSVKVTSSTGWIDLPNITLNPSGDWAIFVSTISPTTDSAGGTVLSIGTPSNTLFKDTGHLTLSWCGRYSGNPWSNALYPKTFVATGRDDAGARASIRNSNPGGSSSFFGVPLDNNLGALVSQAAFGDGRPYGIVLQRRAGVVEMWAVDSTGPRFMDAGQSGGAFAGITNKPFRLAAAHMITQPTALATYWKQSIQSVVVYNGGILTPVQMQRLYNGTSAQSLLTLQASRDDRYYPGTTANGTLTELVSGKHGTFTGTVATGAGILPTAITDDVIVDMNGLGQVLPKDPPPATASKARFWGTRIGGTSTIRMRVVKSGAPIPPAASDIIVDWQTVATGVQNNQTWIGDVTGVPHGFANYDCEVSWTDPSGVFNAGKRLRRRWSVGVSLTMAGQSILQGMRSGAGSSRTFATAVQGYMRAYYDIAQNSAFNMDHTQPQGWQTRPNATASQWGENRMAERLALLTNGPVGVQNAAVGGAPISTYLGQTNERWVRWKRFIQQSRPQVIIWGNGQGDSATTRTARYAALDSLLAQIENAVQTSPGGPWNYQFYIFPVNGNWGSANMDNIRSFDIEWTKLRKAEGKPVDLLGTVLDGTTSDGIHLVSNDTGHGLLASRMALTAAHAVGLAPSNGNGPDFNRSASTFSVDAGVTTITLPVIPNGGTALATAAGGAPSGFKVKLDSGVFANPASVQILSPTSIRLTATGSAANSVTVTYLAGGPGPLGGGAATTKTQAGTVNALYDNRGDLTGLVPGYPMPPITSADPLVITPGGAGAAFEDDFNDGNSTGWTPNLSSLWSIVSDGGDNAYQFAFDWDNTTGVSTAGDTAWTDYRATTDFKITVKNSWSNMFLYARYQNGSNYYRLNFEDRGGGVLKWYFQKCVGGSLSTLGSVVNANVSLNTWYLLALDVNGSTLTAYLNGTQILQATDASLANGKIGVGGYKQNIRFDNVVVE